MFLYIKVSNFEAVAKLIRLVRAVVYALIESVDLIVINLTANANIEALTKICV